MDELIRSVTLIAASLFVGGVGLDALDTFRAADNGDWLILVQEFEAYIRTGTFTVPE